MADKKFTIPAGGSHALNGNGETYLFCKFADRDVAVDIAGNRIIMRAGSYQEFAPLIGQNARVTFYNEDPDNPASVIFVMGKGTYDEKIVTGEISVIPGIRRADGTWATDNRFDLDMFITLKDSMPTAYSEGEIVHNIAVNDPTGNRYIMAAAMVSKDEIWTVHRDNVSTGETARTVLRYGLDGAERGTLLLGAGWDIRGLEYLEHLDTVLVGTEPGRVYEVDKEGTVVNSWDFTADLPIGYAAGELQDVGYLPGADEILVVAPINDEIFRFDYQTGDYLGKFSVPDAGGVTGWQGKILTWGSGDGSLYYWDTTGTQLEAPAWDGVNASGISAYRPDDFLAFGSQNGDSLRVYSLVEQTIYTVGSVENMACGGDAWLLDAEVNPVRANVSIARTGGKMRASGQLIRAALEIWFGQQVKDTYLDHVYGIQLRQAGVIKKTGGETFAAAKIADQFTAAFPQRLTLTIDNSLEFK